MSKLATTETNPAITNVFKSVVSEVQAGINSNKQKSAVDIELNFTQVTISSKGIPLFTKKKTETAMNIRLATRVLPT